MRHQYIKKSEQSHESDSNHNIAKHAPAERLDVQCASLPLYLQRSQTQLLQRQPLEEEEEELQTKLTVGAPNDKYEQEADRVADQVMAMPDASVQRQPIEEEEEEIQPKLNQASIHRQAEHEDDEEEGEEEGEEETLIQNKSISNAITPLQKHSTASMQRQPIEEEEEEELQAKSNEQGASQTPSHASQHVRSLNSIAGQSLPNTTRNFFETRFGQDFSRVRIHNDSQSAQSATEIQAMAYTSGDNIVFAPGHYAPESHEGKRLLAHELTHVLQQRTHAGTIRRVASPAGEGAARTGQANPGWRFQRNMKGHGLRMNPAYWQVTYVLSSRAGTRAITNSGGRSALDNVQRHLRNNPAWRVDREVLRIEIRLLPGGRVTAVRAARDLVSAGSARHYAFECFTASALIQFIGAFRGLQQASASTAVATFNRDYADFRVVNQQNTTPVLTMGGSAIVSNLASLGTFNLHQLLHDASDRGLERGDWVVLDNARLISRGAFRRENTTYLGSKRFFGHGFGTEVFDISYYARRLRSTHGVSLTHDQILRQVRVIPFYRPPTRGVTAASSPTPTP